MNYYLILLLLHTLLAKNCNTHADCLGIGSIPTCDFQKTPYQCKDPTNSSSNSAPTFVATNACNKDTDCPASYSCGVNNLCAPIQNSFFELTPTKLALFGFALALVVAVIGLCICIQCNICCFTKKKHSKSKESFPQPITPTSDITPKREPSYLQSQPNQNTPTVYKKDHSDSVVEIVPTTSQKKYLNYANVYSTDNTQPDLNHANPMIPEDPNTRYPNTNPLYYPDQPTQYQSNDLQKVPDNHYSGQPYPNDQYTQLNPIDNPYYNQSYNVAPTQNIDDSYYKSTNDPYSNNPYINQPHTLQNQVSPIASPIYNAPLSPEKNPSDITHNQYSYANHDKFISQDTVVETREARPPTALRPQLTESLHKPVMNQKVGPITNHQHPPNQQGFFGFWDRKGNFHQGFTDEFGQIHAGTFDDQAYFHFGQFGTIEPIYVQDDMMARFNDDDTHTNISSNSIDRRGTIQSKTSMLPDRIARKLSISNEYRNTSLDVLPNETRRGSTSFDFRN
ncbi:hypothetical protein BC833DRAFT_597891 [Globomyces pollinis-pini]|nr:hypothetical protein BC833DRAFT_597891 [Globomyces pollinis-pini]